MHENLPERQTHHDEAHHERLLELAARHEGKGLPQASYEVLNLTAEGLSIDEIATARGTTRTTVLDQQKKLRARLNAGSNVEAIYNATEVGLLPVIIPEDVTPPDDITAREMDAFHDLIASLTGQEAADKRHIDRQDVQGARASYYQKVGAISPEQAVRRSYERGVLPKPTPEVYAPPEPPTEWQEVPLLTVAQDRKFTEKALGYAGVPMTYRELEVLNLEAAGLKPEEIITIPGMTTTPATIRGLGSRILRSMDVHKTTEAVHVGVRSGLVPIKRKETDVMPHLSEWDFRLLRYCLNDYSSNQISEIEGWGATKILGERAELWDKFGAANNNHLVRRSYELGLLRLPSSLPLRREVVSIFARSLAMRSARKYGLLQFERKP